MKLFYLTINIQNCVIILHVIIYIILNIIKKHTKIAYTAEKHQNLC